MKRPVIWILLFFLLLTLALSRKAMDPHHFTGIWYSADEQIPYTFREGIITRQNSASLLDGAYAFTGRSITLFVTDMDGLETVTTLYCDSDRNGDHLRDSSGTVYFSRDQK